jgi:hypothetical protein
MSNAPLHRKVLEYIEAHPEEHDQNSWAVKKMSCGTTMCYAGTTLSLAGYQLLWEKLLNGDFAATEAQNPRTGEIVSIEEEAAKLLDLTSWEANRLFFEFGNVAHLYEIVNHITDGEVEIPIELQAVLALDD